MLKTNSPREWVDKEPEAPALPRARGFFLSDLVQFGGKEKAWFHGPGFPP